MTSSAPFYSILYFLFSTNQRTFWGWAKRGRQQHQDAGTKAEMVTLTLVTCSPSIYLAGKDRWQEVAGCKLQQQRRQVERRP